MKRFILLKPITNLLVSLLIATLHTATPTAGSTILTGSERSTMEEDLRNHVRAFYNFDIDSNLLLSSQRPCSLTEGAVVARPKWPVFTAIDASQSTCPWEIDYDEDYTGNRFPCRIQTARQSNVREGSSGFAHPCLRSPSMRYGRRHGRLCEPLFQRVPVLNRVMEPTGSFGYHLTNITIITGYTCAFENM